MHTWVFTHGSLMNEPPFPVQTSSVAEAPDWTRTFGHPSVRNWGTLAAPAPTCSLVPGDGAFGVAHLIEDRYIEQIVAREASRPIELDIVVAGSVFRGLAWKMSNEWAGWSADRLAEAAQANVTAGGGPLGDAGSYLANVVAALAAHERVDPLARGYWEAYKGSTPGS